MSRLPIAILLPACFLLLLGSIHPQSPPTAQAVPSDLVIIIGQNSSAQFSTASECTITADGSVGCFLDLSRALPKVNRSWDMVLKGAKPPPATKQNLKIGLTPDELANIFSKFSRARFFEMNDSYRGDTGMKEGYCTNHSKTLFISIRANSLTKSVIFDLGCQYGDNSPFKRFMDLYDGIDREIRGVRKTVVTKSNTYSK